MWRRLYSNLYLSIMKSVHLLFSVILVQFILVSCNHEHDFPYKPNGALEALQFFSAQRQYPNLDQATSGFLRGFEQIQSMREESVISLRSAENEWEAIGPWNTAGRALCVAVNPDNDDALYVGTASGGLWRSYRMGKDTSWRRIVTGYPVLSVGALDISPVDSNVILLGTGEVYNYERSGTGAAYRSTRGTPGFGILRSQNAGDTWDLVLDWSLDENQGVNDIEFARSNDQIVFAATTQGVLKSIDGGKNWDLVHDVIMAMDVAINPANPDFIVAAHGNFQSSGRGIYYSENGGQNWNKVALGQATNFDGKIRLDYSLSDPNVIYASVGDGFTTSNPGSTWLLRSNNAGRTWTMRNDTDYSMWQGWFAHDVSVHPTDAETVMTVGIYAYRSENGGINLPKVTSDIQVTQGRPPVGFPDGPEDYTHVDHHAIMYHPNVPGRVILANDGGVFVSEDGGDTYESRNGGLQTTQFYNGISVSAQNENLIIGGLQDNNSVVYEGELDWLRTLGGDGSWTAMNSNDANTLFASFQYLNIYKSNDAGRRFSRVFRPPGGDNAAFIAPFVIHPEFPDIMYAASSSVYLSGDNGESWGRTNDDNPISNDPIFSMEVAPSDPAVVYCGTAPFTGNPQIWLTQNFGDDWVEIGQNQLPNRYPTDITVDPSNSSIAYVTYSGYGTGHVFKTEDFGETWDDITGSLPDLPTNAVIVDPLYTDHIYVGNDVSVFLSRDGGVNWELFEKALPEALLVMDLKIHESSRQLVLGSHGNGMFRADLAEPIITSTNPVAYDAQCTSIESPAKDFSVVMKSCVTTDNARVQFVGVNGSVIDIGRTELSEGRNKISLPQHLKPGKYFISIQYEGRVESHPFLYL